MIRAEHFAADELARHYDCEPAEVPHRFPRLHAVVTGIIQKTASAVVMNQGYDQEWQQAFREATGQALADGSTITPMDPTAVGAAMRTVVARIRRDCSRRATELAQALIELANKQSSHESRLGLLQQAEGVLTASRAIANA